MVDSENIINKIIEQVTGVTNINPAESLKTSGISSLNLLMILDAIEEKLEIRIPDEELAMSNFETINSINRLIEKLQRAENN